MDENDSGSDLTLYPVVLHPYTDNGCPAQAYQPFLRPHRRRRSPLPRNLGAPGVRSFRSVSAHETRLRYYVHPGAVLCDGLGGRLHVGEVCAVSSACFACTCVRVCVCVCVFIMKSYATAQFDPVVLSI